MSIWCWCDIKGRFSHDELSGLKAELVDSEGRTIPLLVYHNGLYPSDRVYVGAWGLPQAWINGDVPYDLKIKLNSDKIVALIKIGKLNK